MRLTTALLGTFCFADNVLSAVPLAMDGYIHRRHADMYTRSATLERRVPQPQASGTANASGDALAAWNAKAEAACMSKLSSVGSTVSNPAGMAVCYQVPFMDTKSGTFEAELRMYNISAPSQDWVGVTAQEMMVSLAYLGATVQRTNGTTIAPNTTPSRREVSEAELQSRAELSERQAAAPQELSVLSYIGMMNPNIKGPQMNESAIQAFLIPEVELSAMNPNTKTMVQTVLSSKDATFMSGLFDTSSTNTITAAAAASASSIADMSMLFIIPGLDFGLFPVGLIVTMVWVGLFAGFVGLGTIGRYQFREQYIRNMKREMGANVRTI